MIAHDLPPVPDGALLVANGKQALSLVAQELRDHGVHTLLAPDFHCLTMIQPFQLEGIGVRHIATDARALMEPHLLGDELARGSHQAVLHCEVYGARAGAPLRGVLESARARGVPVVVDATHSVLAPSHDPGDYLVASLRKLLPVPDGAFVTGTARLPSFPRRPSDDEAARLADLALRCHRDFLAGRASRQRYMDAVDAAEDAMLEARQPSDMSRTSLQIMEEIDVAGLRAARRANAAVLLGRFTGWGLEVLNPGSPECGLVVRVEDAEAAERDLLEAGIICPVSWPRPPGLARQVAWRTGWIAVPVDPGMDRERLERAADIVRRHAGSVWRRQRPQSRGRCTRAPGEDE